MIFAGIDIGGTRIKMGLLREQELIDCITINVINQHSLSDNLPLIADNLNELLSKNNSAKLAGIGIALPCIVDSQLSKILSDYAKFADARSVDLEGWARENWDVALILENDARAALVGEVAYGAGRNCQFVVMMTLGTGIGSAVMMDGKLIRGKHFLAGNLAGHMSINYLGKTCNCGDTGCVESEASTWALPEIVRNHKLYAVSALSSEVRLDYESLFRNADAGDSLAQELSQNSLNAWACTLQNLIYAYDPERVIISGGIVGSDDRVLHFFRQKVQNASWLPKYHGLEIVSASQPEWAGVAGAAFLIQSKA